MQPKTYIYSKPAFLRLILYGNKNENKRGNLSVLVIPRYKPAIPKVKETVPEDLYKYSGTALSDVSYQK